MTGDKDALQIIPPAARRPGMVRQVILEFEKSKRKHLWLICAAMLGVLLLWFGYQSARQVEVTTDYRVLLYSLPTVNAVFPPATLRRGRFDCL